MKKFGHSTFRDSSFSNQNHSAPLHPRAKKFPRLHILARSLSAAIPEDSVARWSHTVTGSAPTTLMHYKSAGRGENRVKLRARVREWATGFNKFCLYCCVSFWNTQWCGPSSRYSWYAKVSSNLTIEERIQRFFLSRFFIKSKKQIHGLFSE